MPYVRKQYKRKTKRPAGKTQRTVRKRKALRLTRMPSKQRLGFPPRTSTSLVWVSEPLLFTSNQPTAPNPDLAWFSLNSIFKCMIGPTPPAANQPRWSDQYRYLYDRYRVNYATVSVTASTFTSGSHTYVFLIPSESASAPTHNLKNYMERNYYNFAISDQSGPMKKKTRIYLPHQVESITKSQYVNNNDYSANINADPAKQPTLTIAVIAADGISTVQAYITVSIKYNVTFYDLVDVGAS